ncbi:MAG: DNA polymerase III subunit alpha [Deltaproteobacteria bacterium]|jgi:DNA polymerase-3 subunit alpha|nr:DNA polymerase III subunit alpha [Deltaproteobacteria bacterium]
MSFVHLHVHSCYSLLDGMIRIKDLVGEAKSMGMPAVALTDHGQMFGLWSFYKEAKAAGVKPILGVEAYVTNQGRRDRDSKETRHHLTLLAQSLEGYRNLCRMISLANVEGFYYRPRVDKELLARYSGDVIALSACLQGEVPRLVLENRPDEAREAALGLAKIFPGRFYLEMQENGLPQQALANKGLVKLSRELGLPLVATNDCHYLKKEHAECHDLLLCVQTKRKVDEPGRMRMGTEEFYFKSPRKMREDFDWCPEAVENTLAVAERCDVELPNADPGGERAYFFPLVRTKGDDRPLEVIMAETARAGLAGHLAKKRDLGEGLAPAEEEKYRERLESELAVIVKMNFSGYFLVVADFIREARARKIPVGPGRGSAVGSVAAWCLGITAIDPIRYSLLFERFLNPERVSMPDIDTDFCAEGRDEIIRYVAETYGPDFVAQIATVGMLKSKSVIKDVGRALGVPLNKVTQLSAQFNDKMTIDQSLEASKDLQALVRNDPEVKRILDFAVLLENLPRNASTHASGVVIGDRPLSEHLPLFCDTKKPETDGRRTHVITQYSYKQVEENGLVKFDFLGLKNLTLIKHCLAVLAEKGVTVDFDNHDYKDKATFELLQRGEVNGVFQLESQGIRTLLMRVKPREIEDIVSLVALYRPGPLMSGTPEIFLKVRNGLQEPVYDLPEYKPILEQTNGTLIYQEQVMLIAQRVAGYTPGGADELRSAMGKKDPAKMARHEERFVRGAVERGVPEKKAREVFEKMRNFAEYGFNKSHSVAYAHITYQTAYLKARYPVEFMAALITTEQGDLAKITRLIAECQQQGITVLPPDVDVSQRATTVADGKIVFGLGAIKGLGGGVVDCVLEARKNGPFKDLFDFCSRVNDKTVTKKTMETLILCGALDKSGGAPREVLLTALPDALEVAARARQKKNRPAMAGGGLFAKLTPPPPAARIWPQAAVMTDKERLMQEKKLLGFYISGHPLAEYQPAMEAIQTMSIAQSTRADPSPRVVLCGQLEGFTAKTSKAGSAYATASLTDANYSMSLLFFSKVLGSPKKDLLVNDNILVVTGSLQCEERDETVQTKVLVDDVSLLDDSISAAFPVLTISATVTDLDQVTDFLKPRVTPDRDPGENGERLSSVIISVADGLGEACYRLRDKISLDVSFFREAKKILGRYHKVKCLSQPNFF